MKLFICLILLLSVILLVNTEILTKEDINFNFENFKLRYNRNYRDESENTYRRNIFAQNFEKIYFHNLDAINGIHSYRLSVNNFSDLTTEEFNNFYNGFKNTMKTVTGRPFYPSDTILPKTVDWRQKGIVTPIKNQGQCGSCWAFAATGALEGAYALTTKKLISLSEQNLVDCSSAEGNDGCSGGYMDYAFKYIIDNHGIDTEQSYPYEGVDDQCRFKKTTIGATMKNFTDLPKGDEMALQEAVANVGPIAIAIDASHQSYQFYSSGVYDEPACSSENLDHGSTIIGYGVENGKDYWLVKNMWGTDWGEKGYIKMSRNKNNQCGVATMASYPIVY